MATCPNCHSEKPLAAPVCPECNYLTSVTEHAFFGLVHYVTVIGTLFLLYLLISG
jgi:hypothetical protein